MLHLSQIQLLASQSEGQKLIENGKEKFYQGEFLEAIKIFNEALKMDLGKDESIEAHLLLGVCCLAINEISRSRDHFKEIIRINPDFNVKEDNWPPDIKRIFDKTKFEYPIIYSFSILPETFYPYKGGIPYLNFKISSPDCINLTIKGEHGNIIRDRKCFESSGYQTLMWTWHNELVDDREIEVLLHPEKNKKEYSFLRYINLQVDMPNSLIYRNGSFQIDGKDFLPEAKVQKTYPNFLLWIGISALSGYGAYHYFTSEPESSDYYYVQDDKAKNRYIAAGIVLGLVSISSLIKALTPKKKEVTLEENIQKNKELKRTIESLKEKIKVEQKIDTKNSNPEKDEVDEDKKDGDELKDLQ
jgi:tetratricopeptide (TPR) repeat protein